MSYEFEYLMQLLAAASHGIAAEPPCEPVDWQRVAALAKEQAIVPLIGCALKKSPEIGCPEPLRAELMQTMRLVAAKDQLRRSMVIPMLGQMERAGIPVTLLKGYNAARAYAAPECRVSSDVDLWVPPEQEKRACDFLVSKGFVVQPRWANGHHAVCKHPRMGYVELHVLLYDEIVEEIWFNRTDGQEFVRQPRRRWDSPDGPCYVLGVTDDLVFMTLHMVKHFISSGMSLRMLMDVALYVKQNRNELDMTRFWETMRSLRYEKLVQTSFWAAVEHLGFQTADFDGLWDEKPPHTAAIIDDLEQGGWLGFNDKSAREDGRYEYNRQRLMQKRGATSYRLYMLRWRLAAVKTVIRPGWSQLEEKYPWLKKHRWLSPWAWLCYMVRKGVGFLHQGFFRRIASEPSVSESAKTRVELFHALDML